MTFTVLLWFGAARLLYSLIERWSWRFVISEVLAISIGLVVGWMFLGIQTPIVLGLVQGGIFLATAVSAILVGRRVPIDTARDPGARLNPLNLGIIDFSWLSIIAGTLALVCFARSSPPLAAQGPTDLSVENLQAQLANLRFLLGHTIESIFLLGGVLAGCMAILWAGEIWRKKESSARSHYRFTTIAAIRMVVAYFIAVGSAGCWVGIPFFELMNDLTNQIAAHETPKRSAIHKSNVFTIGPFPKGMPTLESLRDQSSWQGLERHLVNAGRGSDVFVLLVGSVDEEELTSRLGSGERVSLSSARANWIRQQILLDSIPGVNPDAVLAVQGGASNTGPEISDAALARDRVVRIRVEHRELE